MLKIINRDIQYLQEIFFKNFLKSLYKLINQERIVIGLSGGSSVNYFYDYLKDKFGSIDVRLRKKIYFCLLDERVVPFDHSDSNIKALRNSFIDDMINSGLIKKENIILPNFSLNDFGKDYFSRVKKIDIGLFGVGQDGHICSLFPGHKILNEETISYIDIYDSPKLPRNRITISKNMLKKINFGFIFFIGESKRNALKLFLNKNINYLESPSRLVMDCKNSFLISNIIIDYFL